MHVIVGLLIVIGSFLLSLDHVTADFNGFLNFYSMILLVGVPIGLAVISFRFSILWSALRGLKRSLTDSPNRERDEMTRLLLEFGRAVRQERLELRGSTTSLLLHGITGHAESGCVTNSTTIDLP